MKHIDLKLKSSPNLRCDLRLFLEKIRDRYGYDFLDYSELSIIRRIENILTSLNLRDYEELGELLINDDVLFEKFVQGISVTVTEMFRDPEFFKVLREKVIPGLSTYPVIKIWVAGCATGEEVYSLAILLKESGLSDRCIIYATDMNRHSLEIAKKGIYPIHRMKDYTSNYQQSGGTEAFSNYYKADFGSVLFNTNLKRNIVFAPHNLTVDQSFNEFQLILCRNVLIYFNHHLQNKVINLFYDSLCPFGYLGLGSKESLLFSKKRDFFTDVCRKGKIYMKNKN